MKKILSVFLAALMIILCFSGCSGNKKEENENIKKTSLEITYDSAYKNFDQSTVNAYIAICNAVFGYEDKVRMNTGLFDDAAQLLYTSFPLSFLISDINFSEDSSGLEIKYSKSKEEHLGIIADFEAKVNQIKQKCYNGTNNKNIYAINLYNYIASSYDEVDNGEFVDCYYSIMNLKGTSSSFAMMFEYLLGQAGIPYYHILAKDNFNNLVDLSAAELNGNMYYFDLYAESHVNNGANLIFFGMTTDDVKNEGIKEMTYTNRTTAADAYDLNFDALRKSAEWKIENSNLLITTTGGEIVQVAL